MVAWLRNLGQLCSKGARPSDEAVVDTELKLQGHAFNHAKVQDVVAASEPVHEQAGTKVPRRKSGNSTADSASSLQGHTFMQWAEEKSKEQGLSVCDFLMDALSIGNDSPNSGPDSSALSIVRQVASGSPEVDTKSLKASVTPQQAYCTYECGAPAPACQPDRVATAVALNELRLTRDDEVESVLRLLCKVFDVETAAVTLLTGQAVWIPYICGAVPPGTCPPRWGFCGWSFLNANHELLVIENSREDVRLSQNFFVTEPAFSLVFYVAAPLISSNGHRLGTLCIFGQEPRKFDAVRAQLLANMAELLVRQFERNWVKQLQERNEGAQLERSLAVYDSACLVVDVSRASWSVLHMNPPAIEQLGIEWEPCAEYLANHPAGKMDRKPWHGIPFDHMFEYPDSGAEWVSGSWEFVLRGVRGAYSSPQLQDKLFDLHFRLAISDGLDQEQPFYVGVPSWLPMDSDNFGRTFFFVRVEEAAGPEPAVSNLSSVMEGITVEEVNVAVASASASSPRAGSGTVLRTASGDASEAGGIGSGSGRITAKSRASSGTVCSSYASHGTWGSIGSTSRSRSSGGGAAHGSRSSGGGALSSSGGSGTFVSGTVWLPRGPQGPMCCPIEGLVLGPLVGKGTYGRVYRGVYQGSPVAVKIIDDIVSVKRDKAGVPLEAALTSGMGHLGVMRSLSWAYGEDWLAPTTTRSRRPSMNGRSTTGANVWMVMEYCSMGCIADAVVKGWFRTSRNPTEGGTNLRTVAVTAYEIASAMQYLHSHGVVHGDLCGGNVMLTASDVYKFGFQSKVGDFGLAREASAKPRSGSNMYGTVTHMPPEVLMDGGVSKATDVYSFGVLMWEMLTGTWAWAGLRHAQIICQVALLKRSLAIPAGLPAPLEKLLRSCLATDPTDRPAFEECVKVLSDWLQSTWSVDQDEMVLTLHKADAATPDMSEFKDKAAAAGQAEEGVPAAASA